MDDNEIYNSEEYKARIDRARRSLLSLSQHEAIETAAESIAYWQMRTTAAEHILVEDGYKAPRTNRYEI